jgi:hypothetical protein
MSTTMQQEDRERSTEQKLAGLGRRIDRARQQARDEHERVNATIERRLDAIRAKDAEVRTKLREAEEADEAAWSLYLDEVDRELDDLEAEMAVVESRMAAEDALDWEGFDRAAQAELAAYERLLDNLDERLAAGKDAAHDRLRKVAGDARRQTQQAGEALAKARTSAAERGAASRARVRTRLDQIDRELTGVIGDIQTVVMKDLTS